MWVVGGEGPRVVVVFEGVDRLLVKERMKARRTRAMKPPATIPPMAPALRATMFPVPAAGEDVGDTEDVEEGMVVVVVEKTSWTWCRWKRWTCWKDFVSHPSSS